MHEHATCPEHRPDMVELDLQLSLCVWYARGRERLIVVGLMKIQGGVESIGGDT